MTRVIIQNNSYGVTVCRAVGAIGQSGGSINLTSRLYYSNVIPFLTGTSGHPVVINNGGDGD